MKEQLPSLAELDLSSYCLFLDRDGVINKPIVDDYAKRPEDFVFTPNAIEALQILSVRFKYIFIVTNQQGIGRELMSEEDLEDVHLKMYKALKNNNIEWFDSLFYAPYLRSEEHPWRKPSTGMVQKALDYAPEIDPSKCIVVGDSPGDMALADGIQAIKVRISNPQFEFDNQTYRFDSLHDFALNLTQI